MFNVISCWFFMIQSFFNASVIIIKDFYMDMYLILCAICHFFTLIKFKRVNLLICVYSLSIITTEYCTYPAGVVFPLSCYFNVRIIVLVVLGNKNVIPPDFVSKLEHTRQILTGHTSEVSRICRR